MLSELCRWAKNDPMSKEAEDEGHAGVMLADTNVRMEEKHDDYEYLEQSDYHEQGLAQDGYEVVLPTPPVPNSEVGNSESENDLLNVVDKEDPGWASQQWRDENAEGSCYYSTMSQTMFDDEVQRKGPCCPGSIGDDLRFPWETETTLADSEVLAEQLRQMNESTRRLSEQADCNDGAKCCDPQSAASRSTATPSTNGPSSGSYKKGVRFVDVAQSYTWQICASLKRIGSR